MVQKSFTKLTLIAKAKNFRKLNRNIFSKLILIPFMKLIKLICLLNLLL